MHKHTKKLMISSAIVMGILGFLFLLVPEAFLSFLGVASDVSMEKFVQLLGSLYISFALINWIARSGMIGRLQCRPVASGNFAHFFLGTLLFLRELRIAPISYWLLVGMIIYVLFAVFFGRLLFMAPVEEEGSHKS